MSSIYNERWRVARNRATDWTGEPIKEIHAGIYINASSADGGGWPIALVHTEREGGRDRAALIAAAPELLEAVKALVNNFHRVGGPLAVDASIEFAEAAIARAENRPSCRKCGEQTGPFTDGHCPVCHDRVTRTRRRKP